MEERIYYLLKAYTEKTATGAEEQELYRWVTGMDNDAILKRHIYHLIEEQSSGKLPEVDWERLYQKIVQEAPEKIRPALPDTSADRRIRRYKIVAVAASITLILLSGIYLLSDRQSPSVNKTMVQTNSTYTSDIGPGGKKAILQAGSTRVRLNKNDTSFTLAGNLVRINEGNVKITKAAPTQLTLITPRGGVYSLVLADGTKVWLNADSRLVYPSVFSGTEREVMLEGEAYFDVQRNPDRPFIVRTADQDIRVLGTEFNVDAYPDEASVTTTLVEGKIRINSSTGNMLVLQPGQQALSGKNGEISLNPEVDVNQYVAWKNGYFQFNKADIHTIMRELSRWYDISVRYEKGLSSHYFGAIINRNNNISEILHLLEATGKVHFKIEDQEVTVMP